MIMSLHFIAAKLLTKEIELERTLSPRPRQLKKKGKRGLKTKGIFMVKGGANFIAVLAALPQQTQPPIGPACWDLQKEEGRLFDINVYLPHMGP